MKEKLIRVPTQTKVKDQKHLTDLLKRLFIMRWN